METKYKILIIVFISYILVVILFFFIYNNWNTKKYMVLSNRDVYEYKQGVVEKVSVPRIQKLNKLKVFTEGKEIGEYKIKIGNEIIIQSNNPEVTEFLSDTSIGLPAKSKISIYTYQQEEMNDNELSEMDQFLEQKGIDGYDELSIASKVLNNHEQIYLVSNAFVEETHAKVFSFIYYKENNKIITLFEKIDEKDIFDMCSPFINNIIDWNQDGNNDLIIGCRYFDQLGSEYDFLEKKEDKYYSILK